MEDLVHDLPRPVDFEEREEIGVAMAVPVIEFESHRGDGVMMSMLAMRAWSPVAGLSLST